MLKFLDLPAHPLFVHAPIVLLPLLTLAALVLVARPGWRVKAWLPFTGGVVVLFVSLILAMESGEALDEAFKGLAPTERHTELAETTRLLCFALLVVTLVQAVLVRRRSRSKDVAATGLAIDSHTSSAHPASTSLVLFERIGALVVLLLGIVATIWMIRTGHEGAKAVWSQTKL
jgi:uncharacterized membrane protein